MREKKLRWRGTFKDKKNNGKLGFLVSAERCTKRKYKIISGQGR